jgi:hypothetical protein
MYIPVAEETYGGTPKLKSNGLKTDPPPIPRAPEIQPPRKEKSNNLESFPLSFRSISLTKMP